MIICQLYSDFLVVKSISFNFDAKSQGFATFETAKI